MKVNLNLTEDIVEVIDTQEFLNQVKSNIGDSVGQVIYYIDTDPNDSTKLVTSTAVVGKDIMNSEYTDENKSEDVNPQDEIDEIYNILNDELSDINEIFSELTKVILDYNKPQANKIINNLIDRIKERESKKENKKLELRENLIESTLDLLDSLDNNDSLNQQQKKGEKAIKDIDIYFQYLYNM